MKEESGENLEKLAKDKYMKGEYEQCLRLCKSIINEKGASYFALTLGGMSSTRLDNYSLAKEYLRKAVDLEPQSILAWKAMEMYYDNFCLYDDLSSVTINRLIESSEDLKQKHFLIKKLFRILTQMKKWDEAVDQMTKFVSTHGTPDDYQEIAQKTFDTMLSGNELKDSVIDFLKNCHRVLEEKNLLQPEICVNYADCLLRNYHNDDALKSILSAYKMNDKNSKLNQMFIRVLVERHLDGFLFEESQLGDVGSLLGTLLHSLGNPADMDMEGQVWFHLGSALKDLDDLQLEAMCNKLTSVFDEFVPPSDVKQFPKASNHELLWNVKFCLCVFLLDLNVKLSQHAQCRKLSNRINLTSRANWKMPRYWLYSIIMAEVNLEIDGLETSFSDISFEKVVSQTWLPTSLRFRAAKRLASIRASQGRLKQALEILEPFEESVQILCAKARCFLLDGQFDNAEELAKKAMDSDPSFAEASYIVGRAVLSRSGNSSEALKLFLCAARLDPYNGDVFLWLANVLLAMKKEKNALNCYERAYKLKPYCEEVCLRLSELYEQLGMHGKNIDLLETVSHHYLVERCYWPWHRLAVQCLLRGNPVKAAQALQCILRTEREKFSALDLLGDAYFRSGNVKSAIKSWRQCTQIDSSSLSCFFQLGTALVRCHQPEEAKECFEKSLSISADFWPSLIGLGSALIAQGCQAASKSQWSRALDFWRLAVEPLSRASRIRPYSSIGWKYLGDCFYLASALADEQSFILQRRTLSQSSLVYMACIFYCKSVVQSPSSTGLWRCLSICLGHLSKLLNNETLLKLAFKAIRKALIISPLLAKNWTTYGVLACWSNRSRLGQHCFINAIQLWVNEKWAWANLGILLLKHGCTREACKILAQTQNIQPTYFYAWFGMAFISVQAAPWDTEDLFRHCTTLQKHPVAISRYLYYYVKARLEEVKKTSDFKVFDCHFIKYVVDVATELCNFRLCDASVYNNYGLLLELDGNYAASLKAYQKALACKMPMSKEYRDIVNVNIGRLCARSDAVADEVHKLTNIPDDYRWLNALLQLRQGKLNEAIADFQSIPKNSSSSKAFKLCAKVVAAHEGVALFKKESPTKKCSPDELIAMLYICLKKNHCLDDVLKNVIINISLFNDCQKQLLLKILLLFQEKLHVRDQQNLVDLLPNQPLSKLLDLCIAPAKDSGQVDEICKFGDVKNMQDGFPWYTWYAFKQSLAKKEDGFRQTKWIARLFQLMPEVRSFD